jgi:hypothetical protein
MKAYAKAWAVALIVLALYSAWQTDVEYRQARIERCAVVHCA